MKASQFLGAKEKTDLFDFHESVPQEIIEGLFIGSAQACRNLDILKKQNITHILNIAMKERHRHFPGQFTYKILNLEDNEEQEIYPSFDESHIFIEEARKGGGVLVHCLAGASRSATIVISYLMKKEKMRFEEAFQFVKCRRPETNPNPYFISQLKEYDTFLHGGK